MRAVQSVLAILLVLVIVSLSQAETIYVDDDNVAGPWDGTPEHPYQYIQDGMDAASNGDTVLVRNGIYRGAGNVNLDFHGKAITVGSENGPGNCIINCENAARGFRFHSGEAEISVVSGFTIQGGIAAGSPPSYGGGIYCLNGSSPTIKDNVITDSHGTFGGGIACCENSSPIIEGNTITGNGASNGGGAIACRSSAPLISSNIIAGNNGDWAGGIDCDDSSSPKILNNIIAKNGADWGGAIHCDSSTLTVISNTITGNGASEGGGIYLRNNSSLTIINTILFNNGSHEIYLSDEFGEPGVVEISYSNIIKGKIYVPSDPLPRWELVVFGPGIIQSDPQFSDAVNSDYRLRDYSLCIGAGTMTSDVPDEDIEGNPRPDPPASNPDIGAYENRWDTPQPIYVDDDNAAGPWHGTLEHPYQCIQDGIDAAWHGNTVLVRDGMYKGAGNVNLDFHGKAITVTSEDGPDNCIIDCEEVDGTRGFHFHTGEGSDSAVNGFTIRNGKNEKGGAILCEGSSPTVRNNIITKNGANYGGGIHCDSSSPMITNNVITKNGASVGGGIYCDSSSPIITQNTITENGWWAGGGISCVDGSSPEIVSNTIEGNWGDKCGGIFCVSSSPMIKGNIITKNYADEGGGGIHCDSSTPTIVGNTIAENWGSAGGWVFYGFGGGGIACHSGSSAKITDNVIIGNTASLGGGIHCNDSSATVANNTIVGNRAAEWSNEPPSGGAGISCYNESYVVVINTILWENRAVDSLSSIVIVDCWDPFDSGVDISHSNVQGGRSGCHGLGLTWGSGNIDVDPAFVDMANDDYHLRNSSPCIGRGIMTPDVPDEDIEGNPRPNPPGSNPDIGAYENPLPAPSVSTTLIIQAFSPVDLVVTDPKLQTIDKDASTIPYAAYIQTDSNGDGDPDDTVVILDALLGNYIIQVLPEPGASPADTYTLDVSYGDETVRLAENVTVQDIPADPYIFFYPLLDMEEGWNLISLPLQPPDTDPGAVLSSISGSYNSVWAFDPGGGWSIYAPGVPIGLERIEPDRGYWIKMDEPGSLIVQGADPEQTDISLSGEEWNLVGYSSRTSRNAEDCMSQVEDSINSVWEYSAKDKGWFIYMPGGPSNLEVMRPGVGYWMKADQECVWDVNATTQLAAPALALKSSRGFASADRPEIPYMVWGSVEIDGVKVTGKDTTYHTPIMVILEMDGEVQYSCTLRASDRCGDFYVLYVPSYMNSSAQPELYVRMDGNVLKAFPVPVGQPGEIIRFDLPIRIAPEVSLLCQNYPNPFNPDTWIPYQLREDNDVVIMIYASTGRLVRTLDLGRKPAGFYTDREKAAYWDGKNEAGEYVASGVYFYSIKAGDLTTTRKMVMLR